MTDADEPDERDELREIRAARDHARMIVVAGDPWHVYELRNAYDRRGPSLIFESEQIIRVVRRYPADWVSLGDDALFLLSSER